MMVGAGGRRDAATPPASRPSRLTQPCGCREGRVPGESCGRGEDRGGPGRPPPPPPTRTGATPGSGCVCAGCRTRPQDTNGAHGDGAWRSAGGGHINALAVCPTECGGVCTQVTVLVCVGGDDAWGGGGGGSWSTTAALAVRCPSLATGPSDKKRDPPTFQVHLSMAGSTYSTVRDEPQVRGSPGPPAANNVEAFAGSRLVADSVRLSLGGTILARDTVQTNESRCSISNGGDGGSAAV